MKAAFLTALYLLTFAPLALILPLQKADAAELTPNDRYLIRKAISYCRTNTGRARELDCGTANFSKNPGEAPVVIYNNRNNYCAKFSLEKGVKVYGAVYNGTPPNSTYYHNGSKAAVTPCLRYAELTINPQ